MIKANELRIGNYFIKDNCQDQITGIFHEMNGDDDFYYIQALDKLDYSLDSIDPVPLTKEWLIKLGFETNYDVHLFTASINYLQFKVQPKTLTFACIGKDLWRIKIGDLEIHINFVHELQNLFFVLTGEELEIEQPI